MSTICHSDRLKQVLFLLLLMLNSWLWMQAIHELGHVLAAQVSGGSVDRVVWHILSISRTDVSTNPYPGIVCWAGPVVGCILPLLICLLARRHHQADKLMRFFAGFSLIANGAYLSIGSLDQVGDAGDLLRLGCPLWLLWIFGLAAILAGLFLWHGLGRLSNLRKLTVRRGDVALQAVLTTVTVAFQELFFSPM